MIPSIIRNLSITILILLVIPGMSFAQMPDWIMVRDTDGNRFFFDRNGKIWTSGKPDFEYKAVSIDGIDYYLNQGIELVRDHYIAEGITLLKSIMWLPVDNNRIFEAQKKARAHLNFLQNREGGRYSGYNLKAFVLLYRIKDTVFIVNDLAGYSIRVPESFKIIRKKIREDYRYIYSGLSAGISFKKDDNKKNDIYSGHDLLIAVDSDTFARQVDSVLRIESNVRNRLVADTFRRTVFEKTAGKIVYSYTDSLRPYYSGFEGFYLKNNRGYHLRTICSKENFDKYRDEITAIVKSFSI